LVDPWIDVEPDPAVRVSNHDKVYAPAEDTYLLLKAIELEDVQSLLEVGTGTGLIALHAARHSSVVATDVNPFAVRLCASNARLNDVSIQAVQADLFAGLKGAFDVIAFNPPYLPVEAGEHPLDLAWSGGSDGNQVILRFLREAGSHLSAGGRIYILLSSHNSSAVDLAKSMYSCRMVSRQRLFFEEIAVWELTHLP
jgi:release factor glutamine methyltransferase